MKVIFIIINDNKLIVIIRILLAIILYRCKYIKLLFCLVVRTPPVTSLALLYFLDSALVLTIKIEISVVFGLFCCCAEEDHRRNI